MKIISRQTVVNGSVIAVLAVMFGTAGAYASTLISGTQIRVHTIPENRLNPAAIKALHGAKGATGAQGPPGTSWLSNYHLTTSNQVTVHPGATVGLVDGCTGGGEPISGGAHIISGTPSALTVNDLYPDLGFTPHAWDMQVTNTGVSGDIVVTEVITCAG
jgi:hypothetical protein